MEKGIKYYREIEKIPSLQNSQETENFTSIFNQCFDALNRKFPAEGIKKDSSDFKVLLIIYMNLFNISYLFQLYKFVLFILIDSRKYFRLA